MSDYRTARRGCKWLKAGQYNKFGEYMPSTSELLLEKICQQFGAQLLQAYVNPVNGAKLVREAQPSVVTHPNGKKKLLQFQYTRFSPLNSDKQLDIYNKNRSMQKGKRNISAETFWKEIEAEHEKHDAFLAVTNSNYYKHLTLCRWPESLYFAVYDADHIEELDQKLKPFLIYERGSAFEGRLPEVHITFDIQPYFFIGQTREDTKDIYDKMWISFPQIGSEQADSFSTALSLHPLNKLDKEKMHHRADKILETTEPSFTAYYKLHSEVPRELSMGLIRAYLRKFCLGEDFY